MSPEPILRHGTWVVVCDGAKALVLESVGHAGVPNTHQVMVQQNLPAHLQGVFAPGRTFGSGGRRATVEQTDFHSLARKSS